MCAILMYHYIGDAPPGHGHPVLFVPREVFAGHLDELRALDRRTVTGPEVDRALGTESLDDAVWLTFDDAHADNYEVAFPMLLEAGMKATFFAITERSIPGDAGYVGVSQLREMAAAGMEIGAHTGTHPRLPMLTDEEQRREISDSKHRLEDALGAPVTSFAYPYGAFCERSIRAVGEAGYSLAVSTIRGNKNGPDDRFLLKRVMVQPDRTGWRFRYSFSPWYRLAHLFKNRRRYGRT